jgi:hypothetical protein
MMNGTRAGRGAAGSHACRCTFALSHFRKLHFCAFVRLAEELPAITLTTEVQAVAAPLTSLLLLLLLLLLHVQRANVTRGALRMGAWCTS